MSGKTKSSEAGMEPSSFGYCQATVFRAKLDRLRRYRCGEFIAGHVADPDAVGDFSDPAMGASRLRKKMCANSFFSREAVMWRNVKKWTIRVSAVLMIVLIALFFAAEISIGLGVRKFSQMAQDKFHSDRVASLIAMVDCDSCAMNDRNHAVWALGQLADTRALPVLEKHYTGKPCDHFRDICQYELQKALRLMRNGYNSESLFWRWMLPRHS
jgi:hypothetical protein